MSRANNESLDNILRQYPYKVNEISMLSNKKDRAVWLIHTNKGLKVIKKLPLHENRVKFILEGIIYLQSKGINIPTICETINKKLYVNFNGTCYILMEAIEGTTALYGDKNVFKTAITEMGNLHRASSGFKPSKEYDISNCLGKTSNIYTKQYNMLKNYYLEANKKTHPTVFEETAMRELPFFLKRIEDIQTELSNSKYNTWVKKASKSGGLSHMDFSLENLIITPSKKLYILDLDRLSMGLPIWDIRELFFQLVIITRPFTKPNLKSMVIWYQYSNPLTIDEWHVVKINLKYPHKIVRVIKRYKGKIMSWSEDKYELELKKIIEREKLMIRNLKGFDHIIEKLF